MKLYYKAGACSLSPHIILLESGLDFTVEAVDLATKKTASGADFYGVNPKGQVPTLQLDDGSLLTEGVSIVQYLADKVPQLNLIAKQGSLARYHAIEWLNYIATELHKGFSPLFNPNTPAEYKTQVLARLEAQFEYLNTKLAESDYLLGEHFTVADAYLFTVLSWTAPLNISLEKYKTLKNYLERVQARPSVKAAMKVEGLINND